MGKEFQIEYRNNFVLARGAHCSYYRLVKGVLKCGISGGVVLLKLDEFLSEIEEKEESAMPMLTNAFIGQKGG